jgi:hypothetical protein
MTTAAKMLEVIVVLEVVSKVCQAGSTMGAINAVSTIKR